MTKSARSRAWRWSVVDSSFAGAPSVEISLPATILLSANRPSSTSISASVAPASAGPCKISPTMFFMKTVEPAPMKATRGLGRVGIDGTPASLSATLSGDQRAIECQNCAFCLPRMLLGRKQAVTGRDQETAILAGAPGFEPGDG